MLRVDSMTSSSITLHWTIDDEAAIGAIQITGYKLSSRESSSSGIWTEVVIDTLNVNNTYTLYNLKCGTGYDFFIISFNKQGNSEPSDTGGLPEWNKLVFDEAKLVHVGPMEANSEHRLRLTAKNAAGATTVEYDVMTKADMGGDEQSDFSRDTESSFGHVELKVIVPVISASALVILSILIVCSVVRWRRHRSNKYPNSSSGARRGVRSDDIDNDTIKAPQPPRVHDDICPYATYELPSVTTVVTSSAEQPSKCRSIDPEVSNMQLKTFSHVKSASPQQQIIYQPNYSNESLKQEMLSKVVIYSEEQSVGPSVVEAHYQLSKVYQGQGDGTIPSPSAPPAEEDQEDDDDDDVDSDYDNTNSSSSYDSNRGKQQRRNNRRRRRKIPSQLHKVPDLLYHQRNSSSSSVESEVEKLEERKSIRSHQKTNLAAEEEELIAQLKRFS
ncbi:hypothetical protein CHUAL_008993 [Chamberlinius hualienensis]